MCAYAAGPLAPRTSLHAQVVSQGGWQHTNAHILSIHKAALMSTVGHWQPGWQHQVGQLHAETVCSPSNVHHVQHSRCWLAACPHKHASRNPAGNPMQCARPIQAKGLALAVLRSHAVGASRQAPDTPIVYTW
jgi:hypothetical protein